MRKPKDIKIGCYTLEEILERHKHWVKKDCKNWKTMYMNLSHLDLHNVDLHGADLRYADLYKTNLCGADLCYANLRGANIHDSLLTRAKLRYADLSNSDLRNTKLFSADMYKANLHEAILCDSDMVGANLCDANLQETKMAGAKLHSTILPINDKIRKGIKLNKSMIGWKKCRDNILVKLEIPSGATVFSINNKGCRTDKAKVLEIIGADKAYSFYDKSFSYSVGNVIEIFDFNYHEYNIENGKGIHFFKTREEAERYIGWARNS